MDDTSLEALVAGVLEVPAETVSGSTGPATEGSWTSLRHLQIVATAQRAFGITLTPREIRSLRTVDDLRTVVRAKGVPV